jgi:hypothetical protein
LPFAGIATFSGGSPFEVVINSIMPVVTGGFANGQYAVDPKDQLESVIKSV